MVIEILKNDVSIVKKESVRYTYLNSFIYGNPLYLEVGVLHFEIGKFKVGENYKILTKDLKVLSMTYMGVSSNTRFEDQHTTQLEFSFDVIYKLSKNLLNSKSLALGVKLDRYINGGSGLFSIFIFSLRAKGLILGLNNSLSPIKSHFSTYKKVKAAYLPQPNKIKEYMKREDSKLSYCSTNVSDFNRTSKGVNLPILLIHESKETIRNLNNFISPIWEIEYTEQINLSIGDSVFFKKIKYVVMEKKSLYLSLKVKEILILGAI